MILWTSFPDSEFARPCLLDPSAGGSAANLANEIAAAPGVELGTGPADALVGGRAGQYVEVTLVPPGIARYDDPDHWDSAFLAHGSGCDPAYFFGWESSDAGAFWLDTVAGDTIRVWVIDIDGQLIVIEAETNTNASAGVKRDIDQIVDSVRFE